MCSEGVRGGNERLLVVDDDPLQREAIEQMLHALGYCTAVATNGETAAQYLQAEAVDLVVLDMMMPPGIDGAETYRRMLECRPGQRTIILTGDAKSNRVREALALGAGGYVRKPLALGQLARAVRQELECIRWLAGIWRVYACAPGR